MDERYLDLVIEECAEIIQCVTKIKRFGVNDAHPKNKLIPNHALLRQEIGDLIAVVQEMGIDIQSNKMAGCIQDKLEKLKEFGPDGTYVKSLNDG